MPRARTCERVVLDLTIYYGVVNRGKPRFGQDNGGFDNGINSAEFGEILDSLGYTDDVCVKNVGRELTVVAINSSDTITEMMAVRTPVHYDRRGSRRSRPCV